MASRFETYLTEGTSQSRDGQKMEDKFRKAQMDAAKANFYDIYMEKPEKDMIREFEYSIDATVKRMKEKGMFK